MGDASADKTVPLERKIDRITALQDGIGKESSRKRESCTKGDRAFRRVTIVGRKLNFVAHAPFSLTSMFSDRYDVCWTA